MCFMGKVQVIYEDLNSSKSPLGSAGDALEKISTDVSQLASSLESAGAGHDNCFSTISTALDELNDTVISAWIEELNSIIASLTAVVAVFTDAEGKIISDLSKVNEDALEQAIEGATPPDRAGEKRLADECSHENHGHQGGNRCHRSHRRFGS